MMDQKSDAKTGRMARAQLDLPFEEIDVALLDKWADVTGPGEKINLRGMKRRVWKKIAPAPKRRARTVAVCALACVLLVSVAAAREYIAWRYNWYPDTPDAFHFQLAADRGTSVDDAVGLSHTGLDKTFDKMLEENGFSIPLPTWIPEDCADAVPYASSEEDSRSQTYLSCTFLRGERDGLTIKATKYHLDKWPLDTEARYDKDGRIDKVVEHGGTAYHVFSDKHVLTAMWFTQPYECSIQGTLTEEEMDQIIRSIPITASPS